MTTYGFFRLLPSSMIFQCQKREGTIPCAFHKESNVLGISCNLKFRLIEIKKICIILEYMTAFYVNLTPKLYNELYIYIYIYI